MTHRLDPLLNPASIAVLGASERAGSVGRRLMKNLCHGDFRGQLYAINPGYKSICGVACYEDMASLPAPVEHVIFAVSDTCLEAALDEVIACGVQAITILSQLVIEGDPDFRERLHEKINRAGISVCGGNSMGYFNFHSGVWACGFDTRPNHVRGGNVTLISQSGSGMCGIVDCEERIDFNLAISTGQELTVALDDYLDYALEQPETRAVGLFIETVRNPEGMIAALKKAAVRQIPVVAIKVGKTEFSARMAITHSGAIAGRDAAYQALFDRYGVQRVNDMHEMVSTLMLFAQPHPVGPGGLVTIHDSGGERQLLIDRADEMGVQLAEISEDTRKELAERLDPGLPPVNPLDAWGAGGPDSDTIMEDCFAALLNDESAALGAVVHDRAPQSGIYSRYFDYIDVAHRASGKPALLVANHQGSGSDAQAVSSTRNGFPVMDGLMPFLRAVSSVFSYRDFCARKAEDIPQVPPALVQNWLNTLSGCNTLSEVETLSLLRDFGIPVNDCKQVSNEEDLLKAAKEMGWPLVLKTAMSGINHKTDVGGVCLGLDSQNALCDAYRAMTARLGPRVLLSPMVTDAGIEMILGMVRDEQFGPLVMLGFGGVHIEALHDVVYALPPFDAETARRLLDGLKLRPMLDPRRGRPAPVIEAYCETAAAFSVMVMALADALEEIDINPIIVHAQGCIAVDALLAGHTVTDSLDENRRAG